MIISRNGFEAWTFFFRNARARNSQVEATLNHPCAPQATTRFDTVALDGRGQGPQLPACKLEGDPARALLRALDGAPNLQRVALVGCGLSGAKLAAGTTDVGRGFANLTEVNVSDNPSLGAKGLAKVLGDGTTGGCKALKRLEARNVGALKAPPLDKRWAATLVHLDVAKSDLGRPGSEVLGGFLGVAACLETLCVASANLHFAAALDRVAANGKLHKSLKMVDASLNRVGDDIKHAAALGHVAHKCERLERLALVKCELPLNALDGVLAGCAARRPDFAGVDLFLGDNAMAAKHGALFFKSLNRAPQAPPVALRALYLDRTHLGTLAIRDLCAALAASRAVWKSNYSTIRPNSSNPNGYASKTYPNLEISTRGEQSSKNQPNRLRFDRARDFSSLVGTPQTSG